MQREVGDVYSGTISYIHSSKLPGEINVFDLCSRLVKSPIFEFALGDDGKLFYQADGMLRIDELDLSVNVAGTSLDIRGESGFVSLYKGGPIRFMYEHALKLHLSGRKIFGDDVIFPAVSARLFMKPVCVKASSDPRYVWVNPYVTVYASGVVTVTLMRISGFVSATVEQVVNCEVNRPYASLDSVLCDKHFFLSCADLQISEQSFFERLRTFKGMKAHIESRLSSCQELDAGGDKIQGVELVAVQGFSLNNFSDLIFKIVHRVVVTGRVPGKIGWFSRKYSGEQFIGDIYRKPIICVASHTNQKANSIENSGLHKRFIDSVLSKVVHAEGSIYKNSDYVDLRSFDDFNHFSQEGVSLILMSSKELQTSDGKPGAIFENVVSDVEVLSSVIHYILTYRSAVLDEVGNCVTAVDLARLELEVMVFEESLGAVNHYEEISDFFQKALRGKKSARLETLTQKKMDVVRKALELDEKISSESDMRRMTIVFGIVASAALSPELIQPVAIFFGGNNTNELKIVSILISFVLVFFMVGLVRFLPKIRVRR